MYSPTIRELKRKVSQKEKNFLPMKTMQNKDMFVLIFIEQSRTKLDKMNDSIAYLLFSECIIYNYNLCIQWM